MTKQDYLDIIAELAEFNSERRMKALARRTKAYLAAYAEALTAPTIESYEQALTRMSQEAVQERARATRKMRKPLRDRSYLQGTR